MVGFQKARAVALVVGQVTALVKQYHRLPHPQWCVFVTDLDWTADMPSLGGQYSRPDTEPTATACNTQHKRCFW